MANPQKEDGYTSVANEILEALVKAKLTGMEWECIMFIVRKTYGYNKKNDKISLTQFQKSLERSRQGVVDTLKSLVNKSVLVKSTGLGMSIYGLNKDYSSWLVKSTGLVKSGGVASQVQRDLLVKSTGHTKDSITKDNIQKKDTPSQIMEKFLNHGDIYNSMVEEYGKEMCDNFSNYWSELNKNGTQQRWQMEKTFQVTHRMATWAKRDWNKPDERKRLPNEAWEVWQVRLFKLDNQ